MPYPPHDPRSNESQRRFVQEARRTTQQYNNNVARTSAALQAQSRDFNRRHLESDRRRAQYREAQRMAPPPEIECNSRTAAGAATYVAGAALVFTGLPVVVICTSTAAVVAGSAAMVAGAATAVAGIWNMLTPPPPPGSGGTCSGPC